MVWIITSYVKKVPLYFPSERPPELLKYISNPRRSLVLNVLCHLTWASQNAFYTESIEVIAFLLRSACVKCRVYTCSVINSTTNNFSFRFSRKKHYRAI